MRLAILNPMRISWAESKGLGQVFQTLNPSGVYEKVVVIHFHSDRERVKHYGNEVMVVEFARAGDPSRSLGFRDFLRRELDQMRRAAKLLKEERVDLIRAQDPFLSGLRAWLLGRTLRLPYVVDIRCNYDLMYEGAKMLAYPQLRFKPLQDLLARLVLRRARLVTGGNRDNMYYALRHGASPKRTVTHRNIGIDPSFFDRPMDLNCKDVPFVDGCFNVLTISRLSAEKYVMDVVELAGRMAGEETFRFFIAGDGPQRPEVERRIGELGLANLTLLGFVQKERLSSLVRTADCIFAPLAGSALVEAGLLGRPVVVYDVEWHGEVVVDGYSGYLVPFRDVEGVAAVLREGVSPEVGQRLRDMCNFLYDADRLARREREIYRHFLHAC